MNLLDKVIEVFDGEIMVDMCKIKGMGGRRHNEAPMQTKTNGTKKNT